MTKCLNGLRGRVERRGSIALARRARRGGSKHPAPFRVVIGRRTQAPLARIVQEKSLAASVALRRDLGSGTGDLACRATSHGHCGSRTFDQRCHLRARARVIKPRVLHPAMGPSGAEESDPGVGLGELAGPGPVRRKTEHDLAGAAHYARRREQQPVAQRLGVGFASSPSRRRCAARPAGRRRRVRAPARPGWRQAARRHPVQAGVAQGLDGVLHPGAAALAQLELQDVAGGVGQGDLVAEAVSVPEARLVAGVGLLTPADGPCPRRPSRDRHVELGHLTAVAYLAVAVDGPPPAARGHRPDRRADLVVHPGADGELDVAGYQRRHEGGHVAGGVGPHREGMHDVGRRVAGAVAARYSAGSWAMARSTTAS